MTTRHGQQQPRNPWATGAVVLAVIAVLFSFFAQGLAFFVLFVALIMAVVALVKARQGRPDKGPAVAAIAMSVLALIIATATSPSGQQGYQQATRETSTPPSPTPSDPNVLPAVVTVATVQSPDNLVAADGRRLHVTMMQGHPASDSCQVGTDAATATTLVQNKQVRIAAPDAARTDAAGAVPPGFQQVLMALPDGRDYAQTWAQVAAERWEAACLTTEPTTTSDAPPTTTSTQEADADVDRPYIPVPPRPRTHSGHAGHPCLPGERDGDHDGYCGE